MTAKFDSTGQLISEVAALADTSVPWSGVEGVCLFQWKTKLQKSRFCRPRESIPHRAPTVSQVPETNPQMNYILCIMYIKRIHSRTLNK